MKVLYDYQILRTQRYGGISRYFYELISRLSHSNGCKTEIRCAGNVNYYFGRKKKIPSYINNPMVSKGFNLINKAHMLMRLNGDFDVFHPTYYNPYMVGRKHPKMVVTVYDMIHERFPELLRDNTVENKSRVIHEADHIIAISESTKRDILKFHPDINEEDISIIYIGTDMKKCLDQDLRERFPKKYILFVGVRTGYKNFDTFLKAILPILANDPEIEVVCTGGGAFKESEIAAMGEYASRFHQINCDDALLSAAYTFAELFVFPSKYEGFGIPTLEAFRCDCPVVLSNTSSMPEVGGEAALYFDPNSATDLTNKINLLLSNEELKAELIVKGRAQASEQKFDWDFIASQTYACYEKLSKSMGQLK